MAFSAGIVDALDPQRLRLIVELRRRGSISAAADACRMGQPSATKHLKTLESAVGEKLVERNGRASRLTEAGEVVAVHAQRVLDTLDGMQEELQALRGAERGTLTLAASTTPGSYVLPAILECFAERHPRVDVDVVIGSSRWVAERVARREVSLGIAGEVEWPDGVTAEPFLDDEVIGIAPPARLRPRVSAEELAGHTLLVREPGSSTRAVAERYLARVGYRPAKRWELDSNEAIKRTVRAGLGIGHELPVRADVPAEHDAVGRLVLQHAGPAALAAVDAAIVDVTACARLEDRLGDVCAEQVVLARLDAVELVDEDRERPLERRVDGDRGLERRRRCLHAHESSSGRCSTIRL